MKSRVVVAVVLGKTTASVFILPPHSISCSGTDNYPKVYSREGMQAQIPQAQTIRYIDTLDLLLQRRSKDCECSPPPTPGEFFSHVEICMMNACKKCLRKRTLPHLDESKPTRWRCGSALAGKGEETSL